MPTEYKERVEKRMAWLDGQPYGIRALVHKYGMNIVRNFMNVGVKEPRHIAHLVETVLDEFSPTRGTFSSQGPATPLNRVDPRALAKLGEER